MKKYLFFVLSVLLFFSCKNSNTVYSETFTIPDQSWDYDSLIQFQARVDDTTNLYQIWLKIEHTEKYPYANLWLKFITIGPDSVARIDTINIPFQDKEHRWLGVDLGGSHIVKKHMSIGLQRIAAVG